MRRFPLSSDFFRENVGRILLTLWEDCEKNVSGDEYPYCHQQYVSLNEDSSCLNIWCCKNSASTFQIYGQRFLCFFLCYKPVTSWDSCISIYIMSLATNKVLCFENSHRAEPSKWICSHFIQWPSSCGFVSLIEWHIEWYIKRLHIDLFSTLWAEFCSHCEKISDFI